MNGVTRRQLLLTGGSTVAISLSGCLAGSTDAGENAAFSGATVHLGPACGCCKVHAEYLKDTSADVDVVEHSAQELSNFKEESGVPSGFQSCHTTELDGGLVIEGHVPVEVMNAAVEQGLSADAVALPGMPSGSPGMPGSKDEEWVFYAIEDGESEVFMEK